MNMKLMKCLSSQHLEEIDYIYADSIKTLNNIKVQAIQNAKAQQQKQEEYVFKREFLEPEKPSKRDFFESKSEDQIPFKPNSMDFSIVEDEYQRVIQKMEEPSKEEEKILVQEEEKKDDKKTKKTISPTKEKAAAADKKKSEPAKKPKILNKKVTKKEQQADEEKEKLNDKQKEKEKKDKNKEKEKEKDKDSSKERKRFIDAGVFEAEGSFNKFCSFNSPHVVSVQTKEGSKLNPDLYQDFKALVILPEKTFILKYLDNDGEFLRSFYSH